VNERDYLADRFEANRPHLRAVAYRMLGSLSEADDAVQEAWLRLSRVDADEIDNLGGWLTTVVARVSLDMLRSRSRRREDPLDLRVPEPIVDRADGTQPEHEALLGDSVGLALLVVLETLKPAERLAFVLHDIFAVPFEEIAPIVDRSPEATRKLASRARRRVQGERTVPDADIETQRASIPTSCCVWTAARSPPACRGSSAARKPSRAGRWPARAWTASYGRRSSTGSPEWSSCATESRSWWAS
jgi:RNA polymerase sigma factor (sigma-70 family)